MSWPFSIRRVLYPKKRYIWAPVRIIHETDKAILVDNGRKTWIPKSRIIVQNPTLSFLHP